MQKFYEQNNEQVEDKPSREGQATGSEEDLELTTGSGSTMHKREPLQVSSEEFDDNTELEQAKQELRSEVQEESRDEDDSNKKGTKVETSEDDEAPPQK